MIDLKDRSAEYSLGTMLFESADLGRYSRGRTILWGLAFSPSPQARLAIRRMAAKDNWTLSESRLLARQAMAIPDPELADTLAILALKSSRGNPDRAEAFAEAVKLGRPIATKDKSAVASWLNDHGAFAEMLQLLPLDEIQDDIDCFTWHLTALGAIRSGGQRRVALAL